MKPFLSLSLQLQKKEDLRIAPETIYLLCIFAIFLVAALLFEARKKHVWSILLLTIGGFFVYLAAAKLCPFLNLWDEQYHALVAKNCIEHPFKPMLYSDEMVIGHDYSNWTCAHLWLHKQPLFLWEIALSFKIFGISELSLRLPSVIHCTLMIPLCWRLALLCTRQYRTALLTAMVAASSWFLFRLTSGIQGTDHNDVCFVFYITASIWALCEYLHRDRQSLRWALLTGLLVGCAVLTKWLVGLLAFLIWGLYLLCEHQLHLRKWKLTHLCLALIVTIAVALPWQLYILHAFPDIAQQELQYNAQHLHHAVEEHQGNGWFYLIVLPMQYFGRGNFHETQHFVWNFHSILCYLVLLTGFVLLLRQLEKRSQRITMMGVVIFVYLFFSFAKTKMPAFTFVLCSVGFLCIGCVLRPLADLILRIPSRIAAQILLCLCCCGFCTYNLNYPFFYKGIPSYTARTFHADKETFQEWQSLPDDYYIFNVISLGFNEFDFTSCIAATFYSNHQCYYESPNRETIEQLRAHGKRIAVMRNDYLDPVLEQDTTILKLEGQKVDSCYYPFFVLGRAGIPAHSFR